MNSELKLQTKACTICGQRKLLSDFYKEPKHKDGVHSCCKICFCERTNTYKKQNQGKIGKANKDLHLRKSFGIKLEQYKKMLVEQKGVCAICGKQETRKYKSKIVRLSIDHNHKTGKIRGLLCHNCNMAIGHFEENIKFMLKAIQYLKGD